MQTRRKSQASEEEDTGVKLKAEKPKRAPKKPRLSPSTKSQAQDEEQKKSPARSSRSPSRKPTVKGSPAHLRKSEPQASSSAPRRNKGVEKTATPSIAPSQDKEKRHESGKKETEDKISINRAPVLTMWVAVVATREGYTYEEGLSFGKAVAGLFAQSKGKRLGVYEEPSEEKKEERKRKRKEVDKFRVFGMNVLGETAQDGRRLAVQSGKQIAPSSVASYLHRSFGANHDRAKGAMEDLANSYAPEEIGGAAYSLYEKFRPTVSHGMKGWGAKGFLDVEYMRTLGNH